MTSPFNLNPPSQTIAGCIDVYDKVINNSSEIILAAENKNEWVDANVVMHNKISDGEESQSLEVKKDIRSNMIYHINQYSFTTDQIFYDMCKTVWFYVNEYANKYDFSFLSTESAQILRYEEGQNYEYHSDSGVGVPRVVSALLYLNDVEEGGQTHFKHFDVSITPKPGRLVIFPSNYPYAHAALPPTKGTKYVAVFWMTG